MKRSGLLVALVLSVTAALVFGSYVRTPTIDASSVVAFKQAQLHAMECWALGVAYTRSPNINTTMTPAVEQDKLKALEAIATSSTLTPPSFDTTMTSAVDQAQYNCLSYIASSGVGTLTGILAVASVSPSSASITASGVSADKVTAGWLSGSNAAMFCNRPDLATSLGSFYPEVLTLSSTLGWGGIIINFESFTNLTTMPGAASFASGRQFYSAKMPKTLNALTALVTTNGGGTVTRTWGGIIDLPDCPLATSMTLGGGNGSPQLFSGTTGTVLPNIGASGSGLAAGGCTVTYTNLTDVTTIKFAKSGATATSCTWNNNNLSILGVCHLTYQYYLNVVALSAAVCNINISGGNGVAGASEADPTAHSNACPTGSQLGAASATNAVGTLHVLKISYGGTIAFNTPANNHLTYSGSGFTSVVDAAATGTGTTGTQVGTTQAIATGEPYYLARLMNVAGNTAGVDYTQAQAAALSAALSDHALGATPAYGDTVTEAYLVAGFGPGTAANLVNLVDKGHTWTWIAAK